MKDFKAAVEGPELVDGFGSTALNLLNSTLGMHPYVHICMCVWGEACLCHRLYFYLCKCLNSLILSLYLFLAFVLCPWV